MKNSHLIPFLSVLSIGSLWSAPITVRSLSPISGQSKQFARVKITLATP
ncbi:MAG: hypothetical protein QNL24_09655 [Akkermansiaceae bacterium]|jgi:hypothetical protein